MVTDRAVRHIVVLGHGSLVENIDLARWGVLVKAQHVLSLLVKKVLVVIAVVCIFVFSCQGRVDCVQPFLQL